MISTARPATQVPAAASRRVCSAEGRPSSTPCSTTHAPGPYRCASSPASTSAALPVAGSSGTPAAGANTRARIGSPSVNSRTPTAPWACRLEAGRAAASDTVSATTKGVPQVATTASPTRACCGNPQAAATSAAATVPSLVKGCGAVTSATPSRTSTVTGPAASSKRRLRSPSARTSAVPTLGWPAKPNSTVGVKMRTTASNPGSAGAQTNEVSEYPNSAAIACICSVLRPSPSSTTASGLPPKGVSVKTSTVT